MKWSFRIGSIFGIPIRVHITFLLLLLFVALNHQPGIMSGLRGVVFIVLIFAGVLIHEVGHSLVAKHYGQKVHDIVLLPIGGVSRTEIPEAPKQEILMAVTGPLISLALAGIFFLACSLLGYQTDFMSFLKSQGQFNILVGLFYINLMLALFNLAPAFPLDGGRVFRGLLALRMDPIRATRVAVGVGQFIAILMFFYGIFYNWWMALIAVFLYLGAEAEEQGTIIQRILHKAKAGSLMLEKFETLSPATTLGQVLDKICHTAQEDFPVEDNGHLVGILPKSVTFSAVREMAPETRVGDIMIKDFAVANRDMLLDEIFNALSEGRSGLVPVVESGKVVGMITLPQIAKYQMVCGAKPQEHLSRLGFQSR